ESAQREQDWERRFAALTEENARWEADRQKVEAERQSLVEELDAVRATLEAQQQALMDEEARRSEPEAGLQAIRVELNELQAYVAAMEQDRRPVPAEPERSAPAEAPLDDWHTESAAADDESLPQPLPAERPALAWSAPNSEATALRSDLARLFNLPKL